MKHLIWFSFLSLRSVVGLPQVYAADPMCLAIRLRFPARDILLSWETAWSLDVFVNLPFLALTSAWLISVRRLTNSTQTMIHSARQVTADFKSHYICIEDVFVVISWRFFFLKCCSSDLQEANILHGYVCISVSRKWVFTMDLF